MQQQQAQPALEGQITQSRIKATPTPVNRHKTHVVAQLEMVFKKGAFTDCGKTDKCVQHRGRATFS
jgi:hypothetical protein